MNDSELAQHRARHAAVDCARGRCGDCCGDNRPLRLQVDLDSMDWLNFLIGLSQQLKVAIAESDYADLVTLKDLLDYLRARLAPRAA